MRRWLACHNVGGLVAQDVFLKTAAVMHAGYLHKVSAAKPKDQNACFFFPKAQISLQLHSFIMMRQDHHGQYKHTSS